MQREQQIAPKMKELGAIERGMYGWKPVVGVAVISKGVRVLVSDRA